MKKSVDTTPYLAKIGYHIVSRARVPSWSYRRLGCEPYTNAMATNRLTSQMFEDGGVESQFEAVRACASGTTPHRRTAAVKLAARIFTALAIAFAISYVAARDFTPDASAAAGKIDVLNVGTCYATSSDVFDQEDCIDNVDATDDQYRLDTGNNQGIQGLETKSTVFATYAADPRTSSDAPRGILQDSDLIKISILDGGRDRRTPVLLRAGGAQHPTLSKALDCYTVSEGELRFNMSAMRGSQIDGYDREMCGVYKLINDEFFPTAPMDGDALLKYNRAQKFIDRAEAPGNRDTAAVSFTGSRASGNVLEVMLPAGTETYLPLHREVADNLLSSDTVIKFYGYLQGASKGGCEGITADQADDIDDDLTEEAKICDLGNLVQFDEDVGSGNTADEVAGGVAPWITFGMGVAATDIVHIRYVYYLTSEREEIIGGKLPSAYPDGVNRPRFTKDEEGDNPKETVLESTGDGSTRSQNLWLRETGRFTGRYEGYLRLTDSNGNTLDGNSNWGRAIGHATGDEINEAAVLSVQGGPVNIRYKDYDGNTQTLAISIDTEPPEVLVETPAYKTNFGDQRVRVVGTFSDDGSRLREDSFRMFLDNTDDEEENGEDGTPVFDLPVDEPSASEDHGPYGCVGIANPTRASDPIVQLTEDYVVVTDGDCSAQFGIIPASELFLPLEVGEGDAARTVRAMVDPDDFDDGATEGVFDDVARLDIDTGDDELNNTVDFQGFVLDIAGNIGFSDSEEVGRTFIHDFGTRRADRKADRYNVLGWYSRHIISIDQLDPRLGRAVTGFYGENDDDEPLANVRGVMLLFDGAIDPSSVDNSTFRVELDAISGASALTATVVDIDVVGDTVYLLLSEDLLPNATPKLSINSGRSVRDPAGNPLTSNDDLDGVVDDVGGESRESEAKDGIPPTFTIELSRGSGTGTGDEGPGKLTKDKIVVTVKSNENLQGTPSVSFLCEGFTWRADGEDLDMERFLSNRRGKLSDQGPTTIEPNDETGRCEDGDTLRVRAEPIYSRPGNTWEYEWRNPENENSLLHLPDGDVTVVAFGRDANGWSDKYSQDAPNSYNWGATTTVFELDSELEPPTKGTTPATILRYGSVQPRHNSDVFESRPFVLLTFVDASTVTLLSFKMNGTAQDIEPLGNNRFLFWPPEAFNLGEYEVEVESVDAAGNEEDFSYEFEVKARSRFRIDLLAGWNAVSVPAMPINPAIGDVFTIDEVDQVVSWDSSTPDAPWRIATKVDGVWSTNAEFAPLNTIESGKGYWVHSNGFNPQRVSLTGVPDRESSGNAPAGPLGISTVKGWNFVGVVDTDGDQTQHQHFGTWLRNSKQQAVTASSYLRTYKKAYTWDPIKSQFNVVEGGDYIDIGDGIWVYYADGFDLAP